MLPFRTKLYYGLGGLSMNLCDAIFMQWLLVRYAPASGEALAPAWYIGICVLLARTFEALLGPITGYWSDGFRSPIGRRLPFIRRGMFPLAIAFFFLWTPPVSHGHWLNCVYIAVLLPAYLMCYNLTVTPYLSLLPEISSDAKERISLTTIQAFFVLVSLALAAIAGSILQAGGWVALGGMVAALTVAGFLPVAFRVRETYSTESSPERLPFIESLRLVLANRAFLNVVISTSFCWFGLNSIQMLLPFWVMGYLGREEGAVTLLMVPFLVVNVLSFFVMNVLANRFGKYVMFLVTCLGSAVAFGLLTVAGRLPVGGPMFQTVVAICVVAVPVAGFMVFPFAILSDVVDHDERLTGRRREAIYFGFQGTFQKVSIGLSVFCFTRLAYIGGSGVKTTEMGLRLVAAVAACMALAAFAAFWTFPLRERDRLKAEGGRL